MADPNGHASSSSDPVRTRCPMVRRWRTHRRRLPMSRWLVSSCRELPSEYVTLTQVLAKRFAGQLAAL